MASRRCGAEGGLLTKAYARAVRLLARRLAEARSLTNHTETEVSEATKSRRGFASMDPERRREIARKGGASVKPENRSFARNPSLAATAGRIGGLAKPGGKSS